MDGSKICGTSEYEEVTEEAQASFISIRSSRRENNIAVIKFSRSTTVVLAPSQNALKLAYRPSASLADPGT